MNGLIDDFQKLIYERDQLFNAFTNQKLECVELKNCKTLTDEENYSK